MNLLAAGNSVLWTGKILTLLNDFVNKVEELVSNVADGISKYMIWFLLFKFRVRTI